MNSLFQQLLPQNNRLPQQNPKPLSLSNLNNNGIAEILKSSDPSSFIQNLVMNNPKARNLVQLFQNSQLTPKEFFYQYARQNGVDPDQFLNSLTK